jgi:hypothetical protein
VVFLLDPCRVHGPDGELVAAGHVRAAGNDAIQVSAPRFSGHSLRPGDAVVLEVFSAVRGECTFDAVVTASSAGLIALGDLHLRAVVQHRLAVRVPVAVPVHFTARVEDGEEVHLEEPIEALVIDVSADGLRFRTDQDFALTTRLLTTFPARHPVPLVVEVLRHEELRGAVAHGCRFVGLSERHRDTMIAYVLSQERRLLAERRDSLSG